MLALWPSFREAIRLSWTFVAVGGKLSALAEKTPCHRPVPSGESAMLVLPVPIVSRWTLVVVTALTCTVVFGLSTVGENVA